LSGMDAHEYAGYRPLMFSIAYRMTGSVGDAEDIVQEAFLRAEAAQEADKPKAYLAKITTRLAIDHLRSARQDRRCDLNPRDGLLDCGGVVHGKGRTRAAFQPCAASALGARGYDQQIGA